ncbi:MAG: hypothetical protein ACREPM_15290, partial [Gemmatimonadaceae bacterium]
MKLRFVLPALAGVFALSASAHAQVTNVPTQFGTGNVAPDPGVVASGPTGGGYYVGPYTGSIILGNTTIPVVFNCVDFFHDVTNSETWVSSLVNLGTGAGVGTTDANSLTRLYGNITVNSLTFSALDVYRAAAYLTSTYPSSPSADPSATIAVQDEIWEMTSMFYPQLQGETSYYKSLDPTPGVTDGSGTLRTDGYSFSAPKTAADLAADLYADANQTGFDYSDYWVVTTATPGSDALNSPQEFIIKQTISTPEPGT